MTRKDIIIDQICTFISAPFPYCRLQYSSKVLTKHFCVKCENVIVKCHSGNYIKCQLPLMKT